MMRMTMLLGFLCSCTGNKPEPASDSTPTNTDSGNESADSGSESIEDDGALEDEDDVQDLFENILQNPSFEEGEAHWNVWGGAELVEGQSTDGDWALRAGNGNGAEQLLTSLEPNTTYRVSGFGKIEQGDGMLIGVKEYGGPQQTVTFESEHYEEQSLTFSTGLSNTTATVFAYKHSGDNAGFADNLSVSKVGAGPAVLVWADEFDGVGRPDEDRWNFEEGFVRNRELQWYQQDNAFQENGVLIIEGREEHRENPNYVEGATDWRVNREFIEYTSSSINTKGTFEWLYGSMVVRAKVTNHQGTWPAIWTLGVDCDWPSNGEVDVMENYDGKILANFAWGSNQPWSPVWDTVRIDVDGFEAGWTEEFHLWEFRWNEQNMSILLDGSELNSVNLSDTVNGSAACAGQNPFQQPHYVLLNLALGGNAGGSVEHLQFPTRYLIDYIRIYQ